MAVSETPLTLTFLILLQSEVNLGEPGTRRVLGRAAGCRLQLRVDSTCPRNRPSGDVGDLGRSNYARRVYGRRTGALARPARRRRRLRGRNSGRARPLSRPPIPPLPPPPRRALAPLPLHLLLPHLVVRPHGGLCHRGAPSRHLPRDAVLCRRAGVRDDRGGDHWRSNGGESDRQNGEALCYPLVHQQPKGLHHRDQPPPLWAVPRAALRRRRPRLPRRRHPLCPRRPLRGPPQAVKHGQRHQPREGLGRRGQPRGPGPARGPERVGEADRPAFQRAGAPARLALCLGAPPPLHCPPADRLEPPLLPARVPPHRQRLPCRPRPRGTQARQGPARAAAILVPRPLAPRTARAQLVRPLRARLVAVRQASGAAAVAERGVPVLYVAQLRRDHDHLPGIRGRGDGGGRGGAGGGGGGRDRGDRRGAPDDPGDRPAQFRAARTVGRGGAAHPRRRAGLPDQRRRRRRPRVAGVPLPGPARSFALLPLDRGPLDRGAADAGDGRPRRPRADQRRARERLRGGGDGAVRRRGRVELARGVRGAGGGERGQRGAGGGDVCRLGGVEGEGEGGGVVEGGGGGDDVVRVQGRGEGEVVRAAGGRE